MTQAEVPNGERRGPPDRGARCIEGVRAGEPLPPSFYARPAEEVAPALLGMVLESTIGGQLCTGRIVEVEAYIGPHDEASHASARIGRTPRNEAMFGDPGSAYVYRIYGVHWCLNAVTDVREHPAAVLIRALEPLEGLEIASERRGGRPLRDLMRGPGNLCRALAITGSCNFHPLQEPPLRIVQGTPPAPDAILRGPRIGISRAREWPLRFWEAGTAFLSASAALSRRFGNDPT